MFRVALVTCLFFGTLVAKDMVEFDYELDAYYSNVSAFIDLDTKEETENALNKTEEEIYKDLATNILNPNVFLIEAAVFPMPVTGVYIRSQYDDFYNQAQLSPTTNLVKSVTAGFEEPYSLSFFVGRMLVFKKKAKNRVGKNRAYLGFLVSVSDKSIKDNVLYSNYTLNLEYKLKGTRDKETSDLDWSFRIGYKQNSNHNFVDTLYVGARRSSSDFTKDLWSVMYNSAFNVLFEVDKKNFNFTKGEFTIEKKFPTIVYGSKAVLGIVMGYIYNSNKRYSGALRTDGVENHQFVFRPNLKF